MDADFINGLIAECDPYIRQYGGREGYDRHRRESAETMSRSNPEDFVRMYIDAIEAQEDEAPFYSAILLQMYFDNEKSGGAPQILKDWVLDRLARVGEGESADAAFQTKRKVGVRKTKPLHNRVRYVCAVELRMREGLGVTGAIRAVSEKDKITERHLSRFMEGIKLDQVSEKTLIFFRDNDVSDDYLPD